jgi:hypothetical protein
MKSGSSLIISKQLNQSTKSRVHVINIFPATCIVPIKRNVTNEVAIRPTFILPIKMTITNVMMWQLVEFDC